MKKGILTLKIILSVWIVYNVITLVVMPNAGSFLGRKFGTWLSPYANVVGLNASWNFFSPDPAHTMYIKYYVEFLNSEGENLQEPVIGYFPAEKNQGVMDINRRRELYVMRFMLIGPNRLQALFAPWLCRKYKGASSVHIEEVIETVAPLDEVLTVKDQSVSDLSREIQYANVDFRCDTPEGEFPL
jgi:hypothetical protein